MNVAAIIVTYGNRFPLLKQVIEGVIAEKVSEVWVVDNGSENPSREQIHKLEAELPNLRVFYNEENQGTAGAYFEVLKYAYQYYSDGFFWFLDDDNLPSPGALEGLRQAYSALNGNKENPVLYSYRGTAWRDDLMAVTEGLIKGPVKDSFCGFDFWTSLKDKMKNKKTNGTNTSIKYPIVKVNCGPYGGLFTHVENLIKIGLPKKEMFVYADDHEFTLRFSDHHIPQYLVYNSQLIDLDMTIVEGGGYFSEKTSPMKLFYGLRNTTYLSKSLVKNRSVYSLNKSIFLSVILVQAIKKAFVCPGLVRQRLNLIIKAISAGEKGLLGKTYES